MKVMHIDGGNLYGGVETILVALARYRDMCPLMQTEFALCYDGRLRTELARLGARVHLTAQVRLRNPWSVRVARQGMRELVRRQSIEAMVCHGSWAQAVFAPAARAAGIPSIFWIHAPLRRALWLDQWSRLSSPDLAIYASRFIQSSSAGFFAAGVRQSYFYPPLLGEAVEPPAAQREELRAGFDASARTVVIIQASRMERWKGQQLLLEALADLIDLPDWQCWIAGGAQRPGEIAYERELRGCVAAHGLQSRIRFLGERADVPALLRSADIYCQPNLWPEPFGIAFLEAMEAGLPVVAAASGGALEIVGEGGVLVTPGDRTALGGALRRLIGDPRARRELGRNGPPRAHQLCDARQQMGVLARLLATVIGRPQGCETEPLRMQRHCGQG